MIKKMNREKRFAIFSILQHENPKPTTELIYSSNFELLIAVILSAQATDISVNKATKQLFAVANTPAALVKLGIAALKKIIRSIGLYNTKAENIIKTSLILIDKFASIVPDDALELQTLPGVGRKTANVILNTAFQKHVIAVDTHIFRVANRTKLAPGKNPLQVEKKLMRSIPKQFLKDAHHWLILHGRYVCSARSPKCKTCKISDFCEYNNKNI